MQFIILSFAIVGIFLSLWIIIPAPTMFLLPLGVVAPEISPWLIAFNFIAILLTVSFIPQGWLHNTILVSSLIALCVSTLPLVQFQIVQAQFATEMETSLGTNYLKGVPETVQAKMRSRPFILTDIFRGIPLPEVRIERDLIFANPDGVELKLNLYRPLNNGKYATIVMIYGGAWRQGTPSNDEAFSRYMANQDYTVIAIDYRHAPKYQFPTQLEDVQTALKYIQNHADELEVDLERMAIMGRSAGGHLAMLAGYQPNAINFRAVVNYYSPVNLTSGYYDLPSPDPIDIQAVLRNFLGGTPEEFPERYKQASPWNHIKPDLPPSLLIYAGRDHLVQAIFGQKLHEKLIANGNLAIYLKIPWAEHAFDAVFPGVSNQLALYQTERFLAWALKSDG